MTNKTAHEQCPAEVREYLNRLRRSGITNMFGAAPYIEGMFDVDRATARKYLAAWMKGFDPEVDS